MIQIKKFTGEAGITNANEFLASLSDNKIVSVQIIPMGTDIYGDPHPTIVVVYKV